MLVFLGGLEEAIEVGAEEGVGGRATGGEDDEVVVRAEGVDCCDEGVVVVGGFGDLFVFEGGDEVGGF